MFDLSWSHIAILLVVALLVLGPKELPNAIRTGAGLLRAARKMAGEFRSGVDELVREAELDETRKSIQKAMSEGIENTISKQVDPTGEIKTAIEADPLAEAEKQERETTAEFVDHGPPPASPQSPVPPEEEAKALPAPDAAQAAVEPTAPSPTSAEPAANPQEPDAPLAGGEGDMKKSA